jgi:putative endopeptidase
MKKLSYLWLAIPAVCAMSCKSKNSNDSGDTTAARTVFFDKSGMDTTVKPGDNFFLYANGAWYKNAKIPASESAWGSFYILDDSIKSQLHRILNDVSSKDNTAGSNEQKVGDFYKSGMDTVTIEKLGYDPLKPELAKLAAVKTYQDLVQLGADGFKMGDGMLFGFYVSPDDKNSQVNVAHFDQTELGLPNRDYYFKTDTASVKIRAAYLKYIAKEFTLVGVDSVTAAKKADGILKLETAIAQASSSDVELRDPVKNYNKFAVKDFQKLMPNIDLQDVLNRLGAKVDTVLVGQPKYYTALNDLLKSTPIDVWKDKEEFGEISGASPLLSKIFRDSHFNFYGKVLYGQRVQRERWKTMVGAVDGGLGELLAQIYVQKYFTPDAKKRMLDLVNNLQSTYRERIQSVDWMSAATKAKAVDKLNAFTKKIGYPDKWKTYDDVVINKDTYYANNESINEHNYKENIKKVGKPVDRTEWGMTPPTVNAYYNPLNNEIVFPAGILQFPFFDKNADDAINYGGIGAVIGHEMTHGFDDQGSQYDKNGNLHNWWTPEDAAKFKTKTNQIIAQFTAYPILDMHVNGALTTGENLADLGGITIAYAAFKKTPEGKSNTKIDGLTPDQRFFLAWAQVWREKDQDAYMRTRVQTDGHSPEMYRVNGPLSNTQAFYDAFGVKPGDKLYRPENERVKVW